MNFRLFFRIRSSWKSFLFALFTISLSFFAVSLIGSMLLNFYRTTAKFEKTSYVYAFLSVPSEQEAKRVQEEVLEITSNIQAELVTPAEALDLASQNLDTSYDQFLRQGNIAMPWIIRVEVNSVGRLKTAVTESLQKIVGVENIVVPSVEVQRARQTLGFIFGAGVLLLSLLVLLVVIITMNAIRESVRAHEAEIEVMRLIGATENYVRKPFLFEGFLLGSLGALLSFSYVWLFLFVSKQVSSMTFQNDVDWLGLFTNSPLLFALLFTFACVLGLLSAYFSLSENFERSRSGF